MKIAAQPPGRARRSRDRRPHSVATKLVRRSPLRVATKELVRRSPLRVATKLVRRSPLSVATKELVRRSPLIIATKTRVRQRPRRIAIKKLVPQLPHAWADERAGGSPSRCASALPQVTRGSTTVRSKRRRASRSAS